MNLLIALLALLAAIAMAAIAAWFSVVGLMALFAGSATSVAIMVGSLEAGKIIAATMLKYNWDLLPRYLKVSLCTMVAALMLVTSMGVFGYLSKAHLEQTSSVGSNTLQVSRLDARIQQEEKRIADAQTVINQLDETVSSLISNSRISGPNGARAIRAQQQEEREELNAIIKDANSQLSQLLDEKLQLDQQLQSVANEVGPLRYVAELIYGPGPDNLEKAVRLAIIILVILFDPFALILMLAANHSLITYFKNRKKPLLNKDLPQPESPLVPAVNEVTKKSAKRKTKRGRKPRKLVDTTTPDVISLDGKLIDQTESDVQSDTEASPMQENIVAVVEDVSLSGVQENQADPPKTTKKSNKNKAVKKIPTPIAKKAKEMNQHKTKDQLTEEAKKKLNTIPVRPIQ